MYFEVVVVGDFLSEIRFEISRIKLIGLNQDENDLKGKRICFELAGGAS